MDFCLSYFGIICKTKTKVWTQGRVPGTVSYVLHDDILANEGPMELKNPYSLVMS